MVDTSFINFPITRATITAARNKVGTAQTLLQKVEAMVASYLNNQISATHPFMSLEIMVAKHLQQWMLQNSQKNFLPKKYEIVNYLKLSYATLFLIEALDSLVGIKYREPIYKSMQNFIQKVLQCSQKMYAEKKQEDLKNSVHQALTKFGIKEAKCDEVSEIFIRFLTDLPYPKDVMKYVFKNPERAEYGVGFSDYIPLIKFIHAELQDCAICEHSDFLNQVLAKKKSKTFALCRFFSAVQITQADTQDFILAAYAPTESTELLEQGRHDAESYDQENVSSYSRG